MKDFVERANEVAPANAPNLKILIDHQTWSVAGPWHFDEENAANVVKVDFSRLTLNFNHRLQIGSHLYLVHPEDHPYITNLLTNLSKSKSVDFHFRVIAGNGEVKLIHGFGNAVDENDLTQAGTPLRESVKQLQLKQELLQKCLDGMPHLVWLSDAEGNFLLFNDRWQTYTGVSLEGSACYQYIKCGLIHPSQAREVTSKWNYSRKYGVPYQNETLLRDVNGDYKWHLDYILPLKNDNDEIEYWVGTLINVHEEFLAEKKIHENNHLLEAIFNSSLNGIQVLESIRDENSNKIIDFEWKYYNNIAKNIFAVGELANRSLLKVYPAAEATRMLERFKEVTLKGEPIQFEQYFSLGEVNKWFEISALKLEDGVVATFHDVTARKQAELDARDSKHFIQQIANSTPDIIFVIDLDEEKIVYVNGKVREYLGLTPEALYSGGPAVFQKVVHPDDDEPRLEQLDVLNALQENETRETQVRLKSASGAWRWFKVRDTVFKRHSDGSVWQTIGLVQDIDDLKTAHDRINLQHFIDRQAQKIAQIGNWQWNLVTGDVVWGENLYELFGLDPATTKPSMKSFIETLHPDDRDSFRTEIQRLRTTDPGPIGLLNFRIQKSDGSVRDLRAASELIIINGEMHFIGTVRDVTQDMINEREIRERISFIETLLESSTYRIAVVDQNMRYLIWNKQCEDAYDLPKSEVLGKTVREVYPQIDENPVWLDCLGRALKGEYIHLPEEKSLSRDDYYEGFYVPLKNDSGEIYAVLTILHDITHKVRSKKQLEMLNESLRQKNFELRMMNEQLSTFAFVASHDLREPLRKIQVFSNSILESEQEKFSSRGREYFERILSSINRMNSMIDGILSFSRIHANAKSFERVDLNEVLKIVLGDIQETIQEKQADITFSSLPQYFGNGSQLQQLFQNLISNAIKFQQPGRTPVVNIEGKIVSGHQIDHPGVNNEDDYLQIRISDNGIGFEEQYYTKIFQMFQRLHGVSQYSGTGMGLAICKKVVENHDGFITVESTPGTGSVFTCYLCIMG